MLKKVTAFIVEIWSRVLSKEVAADTNFFEAGGNSLQVMLCLREIEKEYPDAVKISDFFIYITPEEMAQHIIDNT